GCGPGGPWQETGQRGGEGAGKGRRAARLGTDRRYVFGHEASLIGAGRRVPLPFKEPATTGRSESPFLNLWTTPHPTAKDPTTSCTDRAPKEDEAATPRSLVHFSHGPAVPSRKTSSSRRNAPALLRGSFLFPHLGDWMHEGQPLTHSQSAITSRVAVSHSRATL